MTGEAISMIEVRPLTPTGRVPRALAAVLRKSFLRADPRAGTLLVAEAQVRTWRPAREWVLALPSTGKPDAVTTLCLASYTVRVTSAIGYRNYPMWRMLLLDRHGWLLVAGRPRDQKQGREMWPSEIFIPLRRVGIIVSEEEFANPTELDRAHPARGD